MMSAACLYVQLACCTCVCVRARTQRHHRSSLAILELAQILGILSLAT